MKYNLVDLKKVMFLTVVATLGCRLEARVEEVEGRENEHIVEVTTEVTKIITDPITHQETAVTDTLVVSAGQGEVPSVQTTHTIKNIVNPPTTLEELVTLINAGKIRTHKDLLEALINFPELKKIAIQFKTEKITTTMVALQKFKTIRDEKVRLALILLVTKVKSKDKLWALFK